MSTRHPACPYCVVLCFQWILLVSLDMHPNYLLSIIYTVFFKFLLQQSVSELNIIFLFSGHCHVCFRKRGKYYEVENGVKQNGSKEDIKTLSGNHRVTVEFLNYTLCLCLIERPLLGLYSGER